MTKLTANQRDLLAFLEHGRDESEERIKAMLGIHRNVVTSLWRRDCPHPEQLRQWRSLGNFRRWARPLTRGEAMTSLPAKSIASLEDADTLTLKVSK